MLRSIVTIIILLGSMANILAQGINFEKSNWQATIAKAQKEKKILFVFIGAAWSGESKQMMQLAVKNNEIASLFNSNFINYQADGEIGDGKAIATKYNVIGYPTQLFIDPQTQNLVAKFVGFADVSQLKDRANKALAAHKDPIKWEDYTKDYNKNKKDKIFITNYINKGTLVNANIDHAIDDYIDYTKPEPTSETIKFLTDNIKTLNNKGVDYIVNLYKDLPDGIKMLDDWLPTLYDNTLDWAISNKNPNSLKRILWASNETGNKNANAIYFRFLSSYYLYLKEYNQYWKIAEQQINDYKSKDIATFRLEDSLAYDELIQSYKAQLKDYGVPEKDYMSYINETLKGKVEAKYQASYMAASNINEILNVVLTEGKNNKELISKSLAWSQYMLELVEPLTFEWSYFGLTAAEVLLANNQLKAAQDVLKKGIEKAADNKQVIKLLEEELAKIK